MLPFAAPAAAAAADRDPRQRRRHRRPRLRPLLPRHRGRRGRDRRRADRARPPLLRPAQPAHADLRRGRPALAASARTGGYDAIMVDAYRQPYIPFYLATREFFELARERLAPGGVVIVNVGHPEGSEELERVLGATMAAAFPRVLRDPIEPTNTLLLGRRGAALGAAAAPQRRRRCRPTLRAARPRGRRRARRRGCRRRGLHRRPRPGRVAGRPLPAGIRE